MNPSKCISFLGLVTLLSGCTHTSTVEDPNPPITGGSGATVREYKMKIGRVPGTSLSDTQARTILAEASQILSQRDSTADQPANVRLVLDGSVQEISTSTVEINTPADHAALEGMGYNIIVVRAINECGGYIPSAVGCAGTGNFMAVERYHKFEGMIWAHEFGHNAGLRHRADRQDRALLHPQIKAPHRELNSDEKIAFENKRHRTGSGRGGHVHAAHVHGEGGGKDPGPTPSSVRDYLESFYPEGIPYEHVAVFKARDVSAFREALASRDPHRQTNAIVALAAIATQESLRTALDFVKDNNISLSSPRVRRTAVMALGYAIQTASKNPDFEAIRTEALYALEDRIGGSAPGALGASGSSLSSSALAGLALSGAPEAREILEDVMKPRPNVLGGGGVAAPAGSFNHALSELTEVQARGIRRYTDR